MKRFLATYINNLNYQTVKIYINTNYPSISENDINIIYHYIKNNWDKLYDNTDQELLILKNKLSPTTYNEIVKLINKYKY